MNDQDASIDTEHSLVDAVLASSRVLVAIAARSLADEAEIVTLTQYRTLVVLASRGPQRLADLASGVGVTPATATRMCDRLVRKALVRRTHERGDRRRVRVELTAKGRTLVDAVTRQRRLEIERLTAPMSPADQRELVRGLRLLSAAGGEVPEQDWSTGWDL